MANKYTHNKTPNAFGVARTNNRYKGANLEVGGKRQLGANFGEFCHPLGKTYNTSTGVIGKNRRVVSVV
jgi:hypothetical protein